MSSTPAIQSLESQFLEATNLLYKIDNELVNEELFEKAFMSVHNFSKCVINADLFSKNEELDELSTSSIKV